MNASTGGRAALTLGTAGRGAGRKRRGSVAAEGAARVRRANNQRRIRTVSGVGSKGNRTRPGGGGQAVGGFRGRRSRARSGVAQRPRGVSGLSPRSAEKPLT